MFTAAELAEIAKADAELERTPLTDADFDIIDGILDDEKRTKERERAHEYYMRNREKRVVWQLDYYNAHKERYAKQHHEYYLKNRERYLAAEKKRRMAK